MRPFTTNTHHRLLNRERLSTPCSDGLLRMPSGITPAALPVPGFRKVLIRSRKENFSLDARVSGFGLGALLAEVSLQSVLVIYLLLYSTRLMDRPKGGLVSMRSKPPAARPSFLSRRLSRKSKASWETILQFSSPRMVMFILATRESSSLVSIPNKFFWAKPRQRLERSAFCSGSVPW